MFKAAIAGLAFLHLAACDVCEEKSMEFLGKGSVCHHGPNYTTVCARPDGARFICVLADSSVEPQVVCVQGLGAQAEK